MSVFSIFNNCTVKIGHITTNDGYVDDDTGFIEDAELKADFQPYNGGLALREYGIEAEVTARIYTEPSGGALKAGKIAVIDGTKYDILYVSSWELGEISLIRKRIG